MIVTEVKAKQVELSLNNCKLGIETSRITKLGKKHFDANTQAKLFNLDVLERLINCAERSDIKPTAKDYEGKDIDISGYSTKQVLEKVGKEDIVVSGFLVKGKEEQKVKDLFAEVTIELLDLQDRKDFEDVKFIAPASASYNFQQL